MRISSAIFFVLILFSFSSCEFLGFRLSKVRSTPDSKDKSADPAGVSFLTAGEKLKFHRWLVLEMYEQVFGHPMKDKSEATGWANVLSQRGSIEGVYHGFVYSKEYSDLENGKAKLPAIRFFSTEMAILDHPNKAESSDEIKNAAEKYASESMAVPFFTLKKQLGDRIIKEAVARKEDKSKISFWYAALAARWSKHDVPFGLEKRNNKQETFHYQWALENNVGMIQWELLNRMHRLMNHFEGIATSQADK